MANVTDFDKQVEMQVLNHSIYVWGASGQLCKDVNEEWIRKKESRNENGKHADEAVKAWKAVMASHYKDVARCFDCSGFVSFCLIQVGALDKRRDCDGLYDRCTPLEKPENGALLFRVNANNPNDETHVGVYFDGKQYHAKGRAYGTVGEPYRSDFWAKTAWFKNLERDEPQPEPEPQPIPAHEYVRVKGGSVRVREGNGTSTRCIGIAHKGDEFPCLGQADASPYWYEIEYRGGTAYITCNQRYTEVVYKA